ncbi:MAG: DUF1656 domain-containing protein [Verrucomicrobiae bacterium]|nr:DUF1656 domain-containing protein [Verrucomicrobiae bacterium]
MSLVSTFQHFNVSTLPMARWQLFTMLENLAIIKLNHDPLINIGGAYFPGWLMCMIVGIIGTWGTAIVASRLHLSRVFQPPGLMIPAFFAVITLWTWIFYFSAR